MTNQLMPLISTDISDLSRLEKPTLTLKHFQLTDQEKKALKDLRELSINYNLLKVAAVKHSKVLIDFQTYFTLFKNLQIPECSNIIYFKVLDKKCDDKETLLNVVNDVYEEFIVGHKKECILLEGDQATYERLQSIKAEYGNDLSWMVPFPGDWHF